MKNSNFYNADDISQMLEISRSKAYMIIKELNNELSKKGFRYIAGRVPKRFFNQAYYLEDMADTAGKSSLIDA